MTLAINSLAVHGVKSFSFWLLSALWCQEIGPEGTTLEIM